MPSIDPPSAPAEAPPVVHDPCGLGPRGPHDGPEALQGAGSHRHRPADDRPRRLHREPGDPERISRPADRPGRRPVDRHGLHPDLRRLPAARRSHRRLLGPQAHLHGRPRRVRARLAHRWPRPQPGPADHRPRPAGRVRRTPGTRRAGTDQRELPRPEGARQGVRRHGRHLRCRRCHRPAPRRGPDRVPVMALVPGGEHPDRDRDPAVRAQPDHRVPRRWQHELRHPRSHHLDPRTRRTRVRLHPGSPRRLHGFRQLDRAEHRSSGSSPRRSCSARSS